MILKPIGVKKGSNLEQKLFDEIICALLDSKDERIYNVEFCSQEGQDRIDWINEYFDDCFRDGKIYYNDNTLRHDVYVSVNDDNDLEWAEVDEDMKDDREYKVVGITKEGKSAILSFLSENDYDADFADAIEEWVKDEYYEDKKYLFLFLNEENDEMTETTSKFENDEPDDWHVKVKRSETKLVITLGNGETKEFCGDELLLKQLN